MKIKNWERFQHYQSGPRSNRAPAWIKVYRELLDDKEWCALDPAAVRLLLMLWLLAAENDGELPEPSEIAWRLRMKDSEVTRLLAMLSNWLVETDSTDAGNRTSTVIADGYQGDSLDKKRIEKRKNTSDADRVALFEQVWSTHRRGSKQKAQDAYLKAVPSKVEHIVLMAALSAYVASFRADFNGAHLDRWIRDERWEEFDGQVPSGGEMLDAGASSW